MCEFTLQFTPQSLVALQVATEIAQPNGTIRYCFSRKTKNQKTNKQTNKTKAKQKGERKPSIEFPEECSYTIMSLIVNLHIGTLSLEGPSTECVSTMASVMILLSSPSSTDPCLTGGSAGQRLGV